MRITPISSDLCLKPCADSSSAGTSCHVQQIYVENFEKLQAEVVKTNPNILTTAMGLKLSMIK
jgi:hypothetical protein